MDVWHVHGDASFTVASVPHGHQTMYYCDCFGHIVGYFISDSVASVTLSCSACRAGFENTDYIVFYCVFPTRMWYINQGKACYQKELGTIFEIYSSWWVVWLAKIAFGFSLVSCLGGEREPRLKLNRRAA